MDETTVLKFTAADVTIELQGSEDFVERQIKFFKHYLNGDPSIETAGEESGQLGLEEFFKARASRTGRGAIQEALLLFGYYLQFVEEQPEFSIEQIGSCFDVVGRTQPKNLHHAVGTLKRKHGWFTEGSKRGFYRVSEAGQKLVKPV